MTTRHEAWLRWAPALAVLVVVFILAVFGLDREVWLDEALTLRLVRADSWQTWRELLGRDSQPPLYPVLLTAWSLISASETWLRMLSLLFGAGTILIAMRWAVRASKMSMALAGLLLATSPFLLRYDLELRSYLLLILLTSWASLAAVRAATASRDRRAFHVWWMAVALIGAVLTHSTGVLFVPAVMAIFVSTVLAADPGTSLRAAIRRAPWLAAGSVVSVAAIIVLAQRYLLALVGGDWWMPPLSPPLIAQTFGEVFGLSSDAGTSVPLLVAVVAVFAATFASARQAWRSWAPPLVGAVTAWMGVAVVSVIWVPVWWPRTLMAGLVPFAVAVAAAAMEIPRERWRRVVVAALVIGACTSAYRWVSVESKWPIEPWRAAVAHVDTATESAPVVCMPPYIDVALREGAGLSPERLVRAGGRPTDEQLTELLAPALEAAARGEPIGMVVRVDLTERRTGDLPGRAAMMVRRHAAGEVRLLVSLVLSPDVRIVPALRDRMAEIETQLVEALGEPRERSVDRQLHRLTFVVTGSNDRGNEDRVVSTTLPMTSPASSRLAFRTSPVTIPGSDRRP
jgi:hypothetical protein